MNKFVRNLLTEWRKLSLPFEDETFIVAVSGGADSVSLLLALDDLRKRKKLKLRFVIAHYNHDLRGKESESDAEFVKNLAEKLDYEFTIGKGKIDKKGNLEQNARLARYKFLLAAAENFHAHGILTAHTINDQAETFLLNLIRGSGVSGLSAMRAVNPNFNLQDKNHSFESSIKLVRPLLNWANREDNEKYCHENKIEFCRDAMNEDLNFKRVRVRKILLPLLKEFNPKIIETLATTSRLLQTDHDVSELTEFHKPERNKDSLSLKNLINLSKQTLYEVLRDWLKANLGNLRQIEQKHIEATERLIKSRKSGRIVELPNNISVVKANGKIHLEERKVEK